MIFIIEVKINETVADCHCRMIKVKFFEQDSEPFNESFLLATLSVDYRKIVNLLVQVSAS